MPDETVDPLEELARAVEWYGVRPQTRQIEDWRIKKIAAALREYSRFNAERGKGVWAPRKATAEMIGGIRKGEFRRRALYEQMGFSSSEAFQKAKPTDYDIYEDMLAEAMIAAINPEGNDASSLTSRPDANNTDFRAHWMTLKRGATARPMRDGWLVTNPDGEIAYVSLWEMIRWQRFVAKRARKENPDE